MAERELVRGVPNEKLPLSREEILHYLRGHCEGVHRDRLYVNDASFKHMFHCEQSATDLDDLPRMHLDEANTYCNRTAPFYVLRYGSKFSAVDMDSTKLLLVVLHNYLYKKWFRPYQSEIEYGQFLAKVVLLKPTALPEDSHSVANLTRAVHKSFCARVDKAQNSAKAIKDLDPEQQKAELSWVWAIDVEFRRDKAETLHHQNFYILQPLFRAIAVFIFGKHYTPDVSDPGSISVYIVRTGIEDGLSVPITFNSIPTSQRQDVAYEMEGDEMSAIKTTLETAVGFLMDLEQREIKAYGLRPDPVESTRNLGNGFLCSPNYLRRLAEQLGWNEGMEPIQGPSSAWVDRERYQDWSGRCQSGDRKLVEVIEEQIRRSAKQSLLARKMRMQKAL